MVWSGRAAAGASTPAPPRLRRAWPIPAATSRRSPLTSPAPTASSSSGSPCGWAPGRPTAASPPSTACASAAPQPLSRPAGPADGTALVLAPGASSPLFGGTSTYGSANTEVVQTCPAGTVVVGVHGARGWSFDRLGLSCAAPSAALTSVGYDVALGAAQ